MRLTIEKITETKTCHQKSEPGDLLALDVGRTYPYSCWLDRICSIPVPLGEGCIMNGDVGAYEHDEREDRRD